VWDTISNTMNGGDVFLEQLCKKQLESNKTAILSSLAHPKYEWWGLVNSSLTQLAFLAPEAVAAFYQNWAC